MALPVLLRAGLNLGAKHMAGAARGGASLVQKKVTASASQGISRLLSKQKFNPSSFKSTKPKREKLKRATKEAISDVEELHEKVSKPGATGPTPDISSIIPIMKSRDEATSAEFDSVYDRMGDAESKLGVLYGREKDREKADLEEQRLEKAAQRDQTQSAEKGPSVLEKVKGAGGLTGLANMAALVGVIGMAGYNMVKVAMDALPSMIGSGIGDMIVSAYDRDGVMGKSGVGALYSWALHGVANMLGGEFQSGMNNKIGGITIKTPGDIAGEWYDSLAGQVAKVPTLIGEGIGEMISFLYGRSGILGKDGFGGLYAWAFHGAGKLIGGDIEKGMMSKISGLTIRGPIDVVKSIIDSSIGYLIDVPKNLSDALKKIQFKIPTIEDLEKTWESLKWWLTNPIGRDAANIYNPFSAAPQNTTLDESADTIGDTVTKVVTGVKDGAKGMARSVYEWFTEPNDTTVQSNAPSTRSRSNAPSAPTAESFTGADYNKLIGEQADDKYDRSDLDKVDPMTIYNKYKVKPGSSATPSDYSGYGGNPEFEPVASVIAKGESGAGADAYNKLVYMKASGGRHAQGGYMRLTDMTVGEVLRMQDGMRHQAGHQSTAVGRYQFIQKTLLKNVKATKTSLNEKFSTAVQDRLFENEIGVAPGLYEYFSTGSQSSLNSALNTVPKIWASIKTTSGGAVYSGGGNKATVDSSSLLGAIYAGAKLKNSGSGNIEPVASATAVATVEKEPDALTPSEGSSYTGVDGDMPTVAAVSPAASNQYRGVDGDMPTVENSSVPSAKPKSSPRVDMATAAPTLSTNAIKTSSVGSSKPRTSSMIDSSLLGFGESITSYA